MQVLDPGHKYSLRTLDGEATVILTYVKRSGEKYPGNTNRTYSGSILQEGWRAEIDRLKYLDNQEHDQRNLVIVSYLEKAIWMLECRAAERHHRASPTILEACYGSLCPYCLHTGCSLLCQPICERCGCKTAGGICLNYGCEGAF